MQSIIYPNCKLYDLEHHTVVQNHRILGSVSASAYLPLLLPPFLRTQPIDEDNVDVFKWVLPLNSEYQAARAETAFANAQALESRAAKIEAGECADDDDAYTAADGGIMPSCAHSKGNCKKNNQYGKATRTWCPETCGECGRVAARGPGGGGAWARHCREKRHLLAPFRAAVTQLPCLISL